MAGFRLSALGDHQARTVRVIGTDLNPAAGGLFQPPYTEHGQILYGDSIEALRSLEGPIDLFVNDRDHSPDYEAGEYLAIADKLSSRAVILGDNAHCTDALHAFALKTGRSFLFFQERPQDHWYPGAGIGAAFSGPE